MRRTDRLFDLIQILRDGRLHRAQDMADKLEVSVRTLYRDMDTLIASGVPVEGERGLGYMMTAPITLPPLNLTLTELEAFHLGMELVNQSADLELRGAAQSLRGKVEAVLPESRRAPPKGWGFSVFVSDKISDEIRFLPVIRKAIRARQKLRLNYTTLSGEVSERTVRPLQVDYWGRVWTLAAWCEWRSDFRTFRVDLVTALEALPQLFAEEPGKSLADYLLRHESD
jgi:predicted DNA-binding transcriptional regulator YafY